MQGLLKNNHFVDFDEEGRLVLPTTGYYDYESLFRKIGDYNETVMIEVYDGCYKEPQQLLGSYFKFKELYGK